MDERQQSFEARMSEFASSSKRMEEMIYQMSFSRHQSPVPSAQSQMAISQAGAMVDAGQSSVGGNPRFNTPPLTPQSSMGYRVLTLPPSSQNLSTSPANPLIPELRSCPTSLLPLNPAATTYRPNNPIAFPVQGQFSEPITFPQPMTFPGPLLQNTLVPFGSFNQTQTGWAHANPNGPDSSWLSSWLPKVRFTFPEFDENNPRAWIRHCEKFFQLYQIPDGAKMHYVAIH